MSNEFKKYCVELGITQNYTTPYTQQQNSVIERRNRTVMEMVKSIKKEKELPTKF